MSSGFRVEVELLNLPEESRGESPKITQQEVIEQARKSEGDPIRPELNTSTCLCPEVLHEQALFHLKRFRRLGEPKDLEKGIECDARAIALTPDGHQDMPARLADLGILYSDRFRNLGQLEDLEKSIEHFARALALTRDGDPYMPRLLGNLALSYTSRYRRLGELKDIEKSIEYRLRALSMTPEADPDLPHRFGSIGVSYGERFRRLGHLEDLEKSNECFLRAVALTPDAHPTMPDRLASLGVSYDDRYQRLGQIEDLEKAMEYNTRALALTPDGHPDMPDRHGNLAISHSARFHLLDQPEDLEKSLEHRSRALTLTPKGHQQMPQRLSSLGLAHYHRFRRLGQLEDLEKAIEFNSRALALIPDVHPIMPDLLNYLGMHYGERFQRLGQLKDLEKAIESNSRALALTPDGHPKTTHRLDSLAVAYYDQYRRVGQVEDIENAIKYGSRALSLTPNDHPETPYRLYSVGISYGERFRRLGKQEDLEKSNECFLRAVALTPDAHPTMPDRLANLGASYDDRYQRLGQIEDLEKAMEYNTRALALTPDGHPYMPDRLGNVGKSHSERFRRLGQVEDLGQSVDYLSHALASTPEGHPNLSGRHYDLAIAHLDQFRHTGNVDYSEKSLISFRSACQLLTGPPRNRFQYALRWARLASEHSSLNSIEAYQVTIDLLPQFVWIGAATNQRYHDLSTLENLAVNAASVAIISLQYMLALEWLEHTRCVVWNQGLMLRSPLDELHSSHPDIATKLQRVASQLYSAGLQTQATMVLSSNTFTQEKVGQDRLRLAGEYHDLLEEARRQPGFGDLLRPIKGKDLIRAARNGPIVVIICHHDRCDALLLLPGQSNISHLHLPNFTYDKALSSRSDMNASLRYMCSRERGPRRPYQEEFEDCMERMLATLWNDIVKPILDFLGYTNNKGGDNLPQITWCPTGVLSFLPLHAAGDYNQPGARVFEYTISSYTPTVTALLEHTPSSLNRNHRVLGVGQANTPGHTPLPGTVQELACLKAHVEAKASYSQLTDGQATTTTVLNAMEKHEWVHLACHAHQNVHDPTKSGFFLQDDILDLAAINQRSFKNKGLAFLSACETATGDENLPDEAIHLASGMLMAGYRSVIATMWSVVDEDAPLVADRVYEKLMKDGGIGNGEVGRALHYAVAALREHIGEKELGRWVPYIHMGS